MKIPSAKPYVPVASTAPPPIVSPKDPIPRRYIEESNPQQEEPALNREATSPLQSSSRNDQPASSIRASDMDNHASEQHHPSSFRKIAPRLSRDDSHLRSDQDQRNSAPSKTNPEQLHAILARLSSDTKQSSNRTPTPATRPINRPGSRTVEASSLKSFRNGESDVLSKSTINNSLPLPSSRHVPSTIASDHKQDNKRTHVSRSMQDLRNTESMEEQQAPTEARNALWGASRMFDTGWEPSPKHVEETSQMVSNQSNKRQHPHRANEDKDASKVHANSDSALNAAPSKTHYTKELLWHEETAIKIWADLLLQIGVADIDLFEETVFLIANAKILRTLSDEAFQVVWRTWWQSRPEKTEDEWAHHFNYFCAPFYAAHVGVFRILYQQHLDNKSNGYRESRAAGIYGDTVRTVLMESPELESRKVHPKEDAKSVQTTSAVRSYQAEASPELGSKTHRQSNIQNSSEPKNSVRRQHTTENPTTPVSPLKRAHSSSEVPESPHTPRDTDTLVSKRYRVETDDERVAIDHRKSANKPNGHSRSSWTIKSTVEESSDENDEAGNESNDTFTRKAYKHRGASQPGSPSATKVQANIDRQLWLEEEDAEQAGNSFMDSQRISANKSPFTNGIHDYITDDEADTSEAKRYGNHKRAEDELPFVSDDSQPHPATPEPPSVSELSEQGNGPHNSGPFYEGSDTAVHGDYEDLMSQHTGFLEAPLPRQPDILPSIEEKGTETIGSNKQTHDPENESESEEKQEGISDWIKRKLRKGYSEEILTLVLNASMMNANLARKALAYYQKFNRLPNTKPGIWTEEDDNMLLMHSRKGKRALIEKHGREALDKRRKYLETMKLAS